MTTALKEMQFELLPHHESDTGIAFGVGLDVSIDEDGFTPGGLEWLTQDSNNPVNGATAFGVDQLVGAPWNWQGFVNRHSTKSAADTLGRLASAWRGRAVRDMPGEVAAIRYHLAGRDRRIFGRTRKFEYSPNNLIMNGYTPVAMDFTPVDANIYDDLEDSITVGLATGESAGGFTFPVVFPVSTLPPGDNDLAAEVGGDVETHPIIRFDGGITNPLLQTNGWEVGLNMTIPDGEYVEIDTRPWVQTVMLNGTTSVAGALGKRQWLTRMYFEPGNHDMVFRGTGASGGPTAEVRWRSAWSSI